MSLIKWSKDESQRPQCEDGASSSFSKAEFFFNKNRQKSEKIQNLGRRAPKLASKAAFFQSDCNDILIALQLCYDLHIKLLT